VIEGKYTPKVVAKIIKLFLFFFLPPSNTNTKMHGPTRNLGRMGGTGKKRKSHSLSEWQDPEGHTARAAAPGRWSPGRARGKGKQRSETMVWPPVSEVVGGLCSHSNHCGGPGTQAVSFHELGSFLCKFRC
jgi:hypothetical protein